THVLRIVGAFRVVVTIDALRQGEGVLFLDASRTGKGSSPSIGSIKNARNLCRSVWFRADPSEGKPRRLVLTAVRFFLACRRRRVDDVGRVLRRPCRASPVRGAEVAGYWARPGAAGSARPRLLAAAAGNGHAIIFRRKGIERRSRPPVRPDRPTAAAKRKP